MKKWVFWLVILLLLGYEVIGRRLEAVNDVQDTEDNEAQVVISQRNDLTIKVTEDQIYQGNLLLINKDYPVHQVGYEIGRD